MDHLLAPAQPELEPVSGCSDLPGSTTSISGAGTQPGEGSAQTILDAWLQQLQTDQTEELVVESRLDIDSLFSSELEFDLDFLTELSSLRGSGSGDGGVTLQELSQDLELGLFCPPGALLDPDPVDLATLSGAELFSEQPLPLAAQPETTSALPGLAAAPESAVAGERHGFRAGSGAGSAPPRPPPVASISVVTNKQREKTVVTISTPRGRQSFVLPTADLTQASRVLRALQQKRRLSRVAAAAAAKAETADVSKEDGASVESPEANSRRRSTEAPRKKKKVSQSDSKDDDDAVMSEALSHLGVDFAQLEMDRPGESKDVTCPEPGCDMKTSNMFKLKIHILQHWNYKPYKCSEEGCKWEFYERGKLNRHEATHTQPSLKCYEPHCPAAFRTRTNLQRHRLLIHGLSSPAPPPPSEPATPPPPPPPPQTDPTALHTEPAAQHTDGTDEAEPQLAPAQFRCSICDRAFKMAAGLKRHMGWHEKQFVSVCPFPGCGFTAPGLQQLKVHERRHAEKQYRCTHPECSWAFESHAKLKRHLSQHTGRRNFRCPYSGCEKSYRRMEYLSNHIRLHLGRYYQCPQKGCRLRFTHQFSLATHIRSSHDIPSMVADPACSDAAFLTCPVCDARFKSEIYRQMHLQDVHGTSSSKLTQSPSLKRIDDDELDASRKKAKFNPESLNWVEDGEPTGADDAQTYTVYVPFDVETDSGPSEVLVKCDVTEEECRRLGIELGPESTAGAETDQSPTAYDHVLAENNSAKDTARQLRKMGIGVLSAGLRRTAHSGCARTDITSCHLSVRRVRPRPRRQPSGRQRRPGGWPRKHSERAGVVAAPSPSSYDPSLMDPLQACQAVLEDPPSLLCDSDLLGSVHDQMQHSTINLNDLT